MELTSYIGKKVKKDSGGFKTTGVKPFKSGLFENTVKAVVINPNTNKDAFTFEEDDSIVDAHVCVFLRKQSA